VIGVTFGGLQQREAEFDAIVCRKRLLQSFRQQQRALTELVDYQCFGDHGFQVAH
jgi:hypothetical protein